MFAEWSLAQPQWLWLLPVLWLAAILGRRWIGTGAAGGHWVLFHPRADELPGRAPGGVRLWWLYALALSLMVLSLARPQVPGAPVPPKPEAREIVVLMDVSPSMNLQDLRYQGQAVDRMSVLKGALADFIDLRPTDHFGLIAFAEQAATLAPVTDDHAVLKAMVERMHPGLLGDGTAIGDALGLALRQLEQGPGPKPLLVLFSDGTNTAGDLAPGDAVLLAREIGTRIYTVEVGADEPAAGQGPSLADIAQATEGRFYRAGSGEDLERITRTIDELERTVAAPSGERQKLERYWIPLLLGIFLLAAGHLRESFGR